MAREVSSFFQLIMSKQAPSPMSLVHVEALVHHGYSIKAAFTNTVFTRTVLKTSNLWCRNLAVCSIRGLPSEIHVGSNFHCSIVSDSFPPGLGKSAGFQDTGQCFQYMFKRSEISGRVDTRFATNCITCVDQFLQAYQCRTALPSVQAFTFAMLTIFTERE